MNSKTIKFVYRTLLAGSCCMMLGVVLGSLGTHVLRGEIAAGALAAFQTGVRYQFYHGLGLMALGFSRAVMPENRLLDRRLLQWSGLSMLLGVIVFSGSLYLYAFTGLKIFGLITPLGGSLLMTSWLLFAIAILKGRRHLKSI
ncbi:MAG TPA: DUF423 domain-containing protein [Gammaproteobacteria bacterium]|nr:DUF423 domain-containing protein [Gammaproteobacteria bacterium]